jgi:hypothetical protein
VLADATRAARAVSDNGALQLHIVVGLAAHGATEQGGGHEGPAGRRRRGGVAVAALDASCRAPAVRTEPMSEVDIIET